MTATTARVRTAPSWARELLESQAALRAEVQALRAQLSAGKPRDEFDVALVAALAVAVTAHGFTGQQVFTHVRVAHPIVAAALLAADISTPGELGAFLARLEGLPVAGFVLQRIRRTGDGIKWRLCRECISATRDRSA